MIIGIKLELMSYICDSRFLHRVVGNEMLGQLFNCFIYDKNEKVNNEMLYKSG